MAKLRPYHSHAELEQKIGFRIAESILTSDDEERFYSGLEPVPRDLKDQVEKEWEAIIRRKHAWGPQREIKPGILPREGQITTIGCGEDTAVIEQRRGPANFRWAVSVRCGPDFEIPLLFSSEEAAQTLSTSKLRSDDEVIGDPIPHFFKLPPEIRDRIYDFAIPDGVWIDADPHLSSREHYIRGVGDPTGFYYPLSKDLSVLSVNKQMRREALPITYRRTLFELGEVETLLKFLIAIGRTGRENIQSLVIHWESPTDPTCEFMALPDGLEYWTLPQLHTARCVQLLKQCKRLRHLRLVFEGEIVLDNTPPGHPGIQSLCSLQRMAKLEIENLELESLEHTEIAKMLQRKIGPRSPRG